MVHFHEPKYFTPGGSLGKTYYPYIQSFIQLKMFLFSF